MTCYAHNIGAHSPKNGLTRLKSLGEDAFGTKNGYDVAKSLQRASLIAYRLV